MPQFLTLEQLKTQCRIDADIIEDDAYLLALAEVAEDIVHADLNRNIYSTAADIPVDDDTGIEIMPRHVHAMLLMVSQFYENREAISSLTMKQVPLAYSYLVDRDRVIPV